jgi:hypothetical protein
LALTAVACERQAPQPAVEGLREVVTPEFELEPEFEPERPVADAPPTIPGQLLDKLASEREGTIALPEDVGEITLHGAIALAGGLAFVGQARMREGTAHGWIGLAPDKGSASARQIDASSIDAVISDGKGGALFVGDASAQAWFGALNGRGVMNSSTDIDGPAPIDMVDILAGHEDGERALLLGNAGTAGWVVSLDARGAVRWQSQIGDEATRILAGIRAPAELLVVGTRRDGDANQAWWGRFTPPVTAKLEQGSFELENADPIRSLEAIVDLDHDMGFIALGRAKRELDQPHDQALAVGFDRSGQPTWTRLLDHFRTFEIYGGATHHELRGTAHFVTRIPITGEDESALAWLKMCPGHNGVLEIRQLAGTIGWQSAGFIEGRDDAAIAAYRQTEAGLEWKILRIDTGYVWADPRR